LVRHPGEQPVARDARVVDEDVELARLLHERPRRAGIGHVGLDGAAADGGGGRLGLLAPAAVAEDDAGAGAAQLQRDRLPDPPRRSGDEGRPPLERAERHEASDSSTRSRLARSLTEIARTDRSIRLTSPERTLPGPTSTNVVTPSRTSSRAACVNFTGAVSWSTSSAASRCAGSIFAVTVDMNGAIGSAKRTRSSAGRSRSAARATSGLWKAPETFSRIARRAPRLSASAQHSSTAPFSPETTIWPGQL